MLLVEVEDTDGDTWRIAPAHVTAIKPVGPERCLLYLPGLVIQIPESADRLCGDFEAIEAVVSELQEEDRNDD